jgi:TrpR-related protein YerC/YecD
MNEKDKKYYDNFVKALLLLETEEEVKQFIEDICTIKEIQDMTHRLEVARLLSEGKVFNDISKETGTSSATIGRVNKCLMYGPGGYKVVLERLKEND